MPVTRSSYAGPACPHCRHLFAEEELHTGEMRCPQCLTEFQAHVFHPPQRSARVLQLAQSGPDGATACANHARNAAVASCDRCGLLICSLCQLDVGEAKYCPSCFERLAQEGAIRTANNRFRDYGNLALVWSLAGLFLSILFLGIPLAVLSFYYVVRALRRRENRASVVSIVAAIVISLADIAIGFFYIFSMFSAGFK